MTDAERDRVRADRGLLRRLVSRRVKLKRSGRQWKGLCPFHVEATPSFTVFEDGHFHCFGCQAHGDVFDYVCLSERVGFAEACDHIAVELGSSPRGAECKIKSQGEIWEPILPPAPDAPPPNAHQISCDILHEYHDRHGRVLCYVRRYEGTDKAGKKFLPLTFGDLGGRLGWHDRAPRAPKPLYGLDRLFRAAPDATVLLCEGEKSADAANRVFPDLVGMSWMGGAQAHRHADLAPLQGRKVIVWGDADLPGREAAAGLAARLSDAVVLETDGLPAGFDAADLELSGEPDPAKWLAARMPDVDRDQSKHSGQLLAPIPWTYRDPARLPPRAWLIGTTLLRGYATVLGSMGGVGKTAYAIALVLAFITGRRDIVDQHVFLTGKAWLLTLEDDRDELERRVTAAMIAHNIDRETVEGRLFINTAAERPLLLAREDANGAFIACEDVGALVDGINAQDISLVVIDPLVKSHAVLENSNEHMDKLVGLLNRVALETRSSVLLAAHFRKGGEDGARDAIRGGSALIDGARIVRTLVPMTAKEVEAFKIIPEEAFRYVRVQDAKANLAPRASAVWFELTSVPLGNCNVDPVYPAGDNVQAAIAWRPPTIFEGLNFAAMTRIFERLRAEPEPGYFYSPEPRAKFWAGNVIMDEGPKSRDQARSVLQQWIENEVLRTASYKTASRNEGERVVVNERKVAEILAQLRNPVG